MPFIDLSREPGTLRGILASLGLVDPGEAVDPVPLTGGVSSGIYRVRLRSGSYCIKQALPQLKVAKEWKVPVERASYEYEWLRTAALIVPQHVPRVQGFDEATQSFVMEDLGAEHRSWKADLLAGLVDVGVARSLGGVLGRIHAATADQPAIRARFDTSANFHAIRLEPYLVESARVHPAQAGRLHALVERTASTRRVLVHGDVSPKNILVGPRAPVLLDAECAWFGDPAFDLAFCLNHLLLKAVHLPACRAALQESFAALAGAYAAQVAWEPWGSVEARTATLLPALSLARVDGKSPVEYLGEPQREAVRAASLDLLQAAPTQLDTLTRSWMQRFPARASNASPPAASGIPAAVPRWKWKSSRVAATGAVASHRRAPRAARAKPSTCATAARASAGWTCSAPCGPSARRSRRPCRAATPPTRRASTRCWWRWTARRRRPAWAATR